MDVTIITVVMSVVAALSGIDLGWSARAREISKEEKDDMEREATLIINNWVTILAAVFGAVGGFGIASLKKVVAFSLMKRKRR